MLRFEKNIPLFSQTTVQVDTGKSLTEAVILASTNPQYDKRLFIELQVQYMLCTQIVLNVKTKKTNLCTQHVLNLLFSCTELIIQ